MSHTLLRCNKCDKIIAGCTCPKPTEIEIDIIEYIEKNFFDETDADKNGILEEWREFKEKAKGHTKFKIIQYDTHGDKKPDMCQGVICQDCEQPATKIGVNCPFQEEIKHKNVKITVCDNCYKRRLDEI